MSTVQSISQLAVSHAARRCAGIALLSAFTLSGCNDSETISIPSYDVPNSVAIADVDGDGNADLVVALTQVLYGAPDPGLVSVLLRDDTVPGNFRIAEELPAGFNPSTLVLGNLDAGTSPDIAVANAGSGDVSVLLQAPAPPGTYLAPAAVATGGSPLDVAAGDIDDDGATDLVIASFESGGSALIAYQNPAQPGQFAAPVHLALDRPVTSVAIGDIDGDGRADIAVTVQDATGSNGAVAVFLQDPVTDRQFLAPVSFPAGAEPLAVKIVDLNDDGRADLVLVNEGPGFDGQGVAGLTVLLQGNMPALSFLAPVSYAAGQRPVHLAVGDLNGDDRPDIVVADRGGSRGAVKVLLQDPAGGGVFLSATSYPGFYGPLGVAIGDLNGDLLPDIAAADGVRGTVHYQQAGNPGLFAAAAAVGLQ